MKEAVRKSGSVSEFIREILKSLEREHGSAKPARAGGLNYDLHDFADGTVFKITASYGRIYVEEV